MRSAQFLVKATVATVALVCATQAEAGSPWRSRDREGQEAQGIGCYWMHERLYCARYCYIGIDGRRYCRERKRLARPQAPPEFFEERWGGAMKLAGPRGALR